MPLALMSATRTTTFGLYKLDRHEARACSDWRVTRTAPKPSTSMRLLRHLFKMPAWRQKKSQVTDIINVRSFPPVDSHPRQVCESYFNIEPLFVEPGIKDRH